MSNRFIYPIDVPSIPYWKGASDLAGYSGDLFFGAYNRSTNAQIHNATAIAKRRGFARAIAERFKGHATGEFSREKGRPVHVLADGAGIKVLQSIPQIDGGTGSGFTQGPGHLWDDFNRADSADVNVAGTNYKWSESLSAEGSISTSDYNRIADKTWFAGEYANPANNILRAGYLDKLGQASEPVSHYVTRAEFNLSGVEIEASDADYSVLDSYGKGQNIADDRWHFFSVAQGLPGPWRSGSSGNGRKGFSVKNATNHTYNTFHSEQPWAGAVCIVEFRQVTLDAEVPLFAMRMRVFEFGCRHNEATTLTSATDGVALSSSAWDASNPGGNNEDGLDAEDGVYEIKNLTMAQLQSTHVIEFGRVMTSSNTWLTRAKLYIDSTIKGVSGSSIPDLDIFKKETAVGLASEKESSGANIYIVRPKQMTSAVSTFGGLGMGHTTPGSAIGSVPGTMTTEWGMRCNAVIVAENFL